VLLGKYFYIITKYRFNLSFCHKTLKGWRLFKIFKVIMHEFVSSQLCVRSFFKFFENVTKTVHYFFVLWFLILAFYTNSRLVFYLLVVFLINFISFECFISQSSLTSEHTEFLKQEKVNLKLWITEAISI